MTIESRRWPYDIQIKMDELDLMFRIVLYLCAYHLCLKKPWLFQFDLNLFFIILVHKVSPSKQ